MRIYLIKIFKVCFVVYRIVQLSGGAGLDIINENYENYIMFT